MIVEKLPCLGLTAKHEMLLGNEGDLHTIDVEELVKGSENFWYWRFGNTRALFHPFMTKSQKSPETHFLMCELLGNLYRRHKEKEGGVLPEHPFFVSQKNGSQVKAAEELVAIGLAVTAARKSSEDTYIGFHLVPEVVEKLITTNKGSNPRSFCKLRGSVAALEMTVVDCLNFLNGRGWGCHSWETKLGKKHKIKERQHFKADKKSKEYFVIADGFKVNLWYFRCLVKLLQGDLESDFVPHWARVVDYKRLLGIKRVDPRPSRKGRKTGKSKLVKARKESNRNRAKASL